MKKMLKTIATSAIAIGMVSQAVMAADYLVSLNSKMAAFLESRAYAAKMGATAEFRKMEGVAYDKKNNIAYIAMSAIDKGMSDDKGDIKLPQNKCGIVYALPLNSKYNADKMIPVVVGGKYNKKNKDRCDVDMIANPDGVDVDSQGNVWIAEDTSNHQNNVLWKWDVKRKQLMRFATVPKKAEITGLHITANDEIFFNVQHPSAMSKFPYNRAVVGVINDFKATDSFRALKVPKGDDMLDVKVAKGSYQVLSRVGEQIPNGVYANRFGQINNMDGTLKIVCNHPDGNMFLPINSKGSFGYLYTNYECRPGGVVKTYIRNNGKSWQVLEGENVNFASVNGTWNNCNASVTPWNTGLTSEEYEPKATKSGWKKNVKDVTEYLGKQANPYHYGYPVELIPDSRGNVVTTNLVKHYAMGRMSYEMSKVMPDNRTVYSGDDGTNVVLFKFVADKAQKLGAGTLYAAKVKQNSDQSLSLRWIELGRSNNAEVYQAIQSVSLR